MNEIYTLRLRSSVDDPGHPLALRSFALAAVALLLPIAVLVALGALLVVICVLTIAVQIDGYRGQEEEI